MANVNFKLDADVKRISEKAAAHGLTVGELIENFIGDLVCGTYSNGSGERMYAEQWFERCWFAMFPDLTNGKGTPFYSSKEEWEQEERTVISDWREEVETDKQTLSEYWNEYTEQKKEYKNGTFEEK